MSEMKGLNIVSDNNPGRSLSLQFSSLMIVDGGFSYDRLPPQTLTLSILKLDASSFDVEVANTATVAKLKQAVELAFSHMPQKGPGKISWPHVWGQFCLCYKGQKLVTASDYLRAYGIRDGDQLRFEHHVSNETCSFQKKRQKKRVPNLKQHVRSSPQVSRCQQKEHIDDDEIDLDQILIDNGKNKHCDAEEDCLKKSRLPGFLGGLFSEARLEVVRRARMEGGVCHSMISKGIVSGFRKLRGVLSHSSRQHSYRKQTWNE